METLKGKKVHLLKIENAQLFIYFFYVAHKQHILVRIKGVNVQNYKSYIKDKRKIFLYAGA
jgi:hypothetical protein